MGLQTIVFIFNGCGLLSDRVCRVVDAVMRFTYSAMVAHSIDQCPGLRLITLTLCVRVGQREWMRKVFNLSLSSR